jgi:hypothetical protein
MGTCLFCVFLKALEKVGGSPKLAALLLLLISKAQKMTTCHVRDLPV